MSEKGRWSNPAVPWYPLPYMDEYIEELTAMLRTDGYIRKVRLGLAHFAQFCHADGISHPDELTRTHILRYQAKINRQPWTQSYRQQLMRYVRSWINWMLEVGYLIDDPWQHIKIGRVRKTPNPLSDEEVSMLFEAHRHQALSTPPFNFHRREVILVLLYAWGLRLHELLALNVANMDLRLEYVTAINKGSSTKTLPYPQSMKTVIQRYLPLRARHAAIGEDALLIDQKGQRLSHDLAYRTVTHLGQKAGITIHPHQLRDTCGTHLLNSDVEVERVQQILGHSNIGQTLAYSKVHNHKVKEAHDRAMSPRLDELLSFKSTEDLKGNPPTEQETP